MRSQGYNSRRYIDDRAQTEIAGGINLHYGIKEIRRESTDKQPISEIRKAWFEYQRVGRGSFRLLDGCIGRSTGERANRSAGGADRQVL